MKCIVLAKMGKRVGAAIIDLIITLVLSITVFLTLVLPFTIDMDKFQGNEKTKYEIMGLSGLYQIYTVADTIYSELEFDIVIADEQFKNNNITHENLIPSLNEYHYKVNNETFYTVDSLVRFYFENPHYKNESGELVPIFRKTALTWEQILTKFEVGNEKSNIKEISLNSENNKYEISMIDPKKQTTTVEFIAQLIKPDQYDDNEKSASELVITSEPYVIADEANKNMMLMALLYIFPVLFGFSFIFYFIIPICSKNGETLGKYFLGLGVLTHDGYVLPKYWYIPRYLIFFIVELALGILSFGGLFLVSYLMFCFSKKRRSLHDFAGNSVVVDKKDSIWFKNREQEYKYNYKTRINEE